MLRLFVTLFGLFAFAAVADNHDHAHHDHGDHKAALGAVTLLHAWAAESQGADALVYVEIDNAGDVPVTLLGAETDIAADVKLVGFQSKDGGTSYVALPKVSIAAGAEMTLEPGGVAFRMTQMSRHLHEGDEFEIHIVFDTGEVEVMVQIEAPGATQHSHAGHNH